MKLKDHFILQDKDEVIQNERLDIISNISQFWWQILKT